MLTTALSYRAISADLDRSLARVSADPINARETEYYSKKITTIKSIDDFMGDTRIFNYAMKAHGLEDMSYAKAFMRKVLEEGIDNDESFANQLTDPRYKQFAEAFNFKRHEATATIFERAQSGTVQKYNRQALETSAGQDNEGVRLALYFTRQAESVTDTLDLLGDSALLRVTQVALGLPQATGGLSIDKQIELIEQRLNIEDLKDPQKLDALMTRFTALWDIENGGSTSFSPEVMLIAGDNGTGPDLSTLLTLQSNRFLF